MPRKLIFINCVSDLDDISNEILSSSINISDKACICLDELPLAIIIKSAIDDLSFKSIDWMSVALLSFKVFSISFFNIIISLNFIKKYFTKVF